MFRALYYSHSGLRYVVLLTGIIVLLYALYATFSKKPWSGGGRGMGSAFVGLLDLQILLGFAVLPYAWRPALIGHFSMMLVGAIAAHALLVVNRKKATPTWGMLALAVAIALICIVVGIFAIGRSPFAMTAT